MNYFHAMCRINRLTGVVKALLYILMRDNVKIKYAYKLTASAVFILVKCMKQF